MAVQVQLTFNSVDEAIVALGKMVLATKPAVVVSAAPPVEKTPRQGRSDAGKPRGPHKDKKDEPNAAGAGAGATSAVSAGNSSTVTTDPSNAGKQAAASTSTTTAAPGGAALHAAPSTNAPAAPAATIPTTDQVQAAVEKLFTAKGFDDCESVLKLRFGVPRGKDIPPERRAEFIAKVDRVIAGEAV